MDSLSAVDARKLIRNGTYKNKITGGWCKGHQQANITILHKNDAEHFSKFAHFNSGCFPILHQSNPSQKDTPLSNDSDITTDLPGYMIYKNGKFEKFMTNVSDLDWKDMVTYYIGCSYSFDGILAEHGVPLRNVEQNIDVPMYKANVECYPAGPFECNMTISMRPIPEELLTLTADMTSQMPEVHGAPVHIGDPSDILALGADIDHPIIEPAVKIHTGDVPVFWACGCTSECAIKNAKCHFAITHYPGMMYICDQKQSAYDQFKPDSEKCLVVMFSSQRYSILSKEANERLNQLERTIYPGEHGDSGKQKVMSNDFVKSSLALSHSESVAIISPGIDLTDENMLGIYSLVIMLQASGKQVVVIVHQQEVKKNKEIMKWLLEYANKDTKLENDIILSIEDHTGKSQNEPEIYAFRNLFETEKKRKTIVRICMNADKVKSPPKICVEKMTSTDTSEDLLISTDYCKDACYALTAALFALRKCKIHDRYYRKATGPSTDVSKLTWAIPTVHKERQILQAMDQMKSNDCMFVDAQKFEELHKIIGYGME